VVTADTEAIEERLAQEKEVPRQDFHELACALEARIVSYSHLGREAGPVLRLIGRFVGRGVALALLAFRRKGTFYFTTAENAGLPLAFLLKFRPAASHAMIGHKISASKKRLVTKWLGLFNHIDRAICYSEAQLDYARDYLDVPEEKLRRIEFQVDANFYAPGEGDAGTGVVSVGRELRDYRTLFEAVRGTDIPVTVVASSPWSKRADQTERCPIPDNVTLRKDLSYGELRDLYRGCEVVVVPLQDVDSAAGITTILEAQAVGKPVIVSHTPGILDSIEPGVDAVTVPCGDPEALRAAIQEIINHPEKAARLGETAREKVAAEKNIDVFVERIVEICGQ
jgi:glycosyltransferase involved in cell wall biosynthesis